MAHDFKLNEETGVQMKRKKTGTGIIGLFIKSGIVKNEGQANALMLFLIVAGIAAIVFINLRTFGS
jgi:hypothetical protein